MAAVFIKGRKQTLVGGSCLFLIFMSDYSMITQTDGNLTVYTVFTTRKVSRNIRSLRLCKSCKRFFASPLNVARSDGIISYSRKEPPYRITAAGLPSPSQNRTYTSQCIRIAVIDCKALCFGGAFFTFRKLSL